MNLFSTVFLQGLYASLISPPQSFLNRFFRASQTETNSESIAFDVEDKQRRLAPFVSPVVAGVVEDGVGITAHTFKPAYIKPKRAFDPSRALKRVGGEAIGGAMSKIQRWATLLGMDLREMLETMDRREEVMAAELLRTGKITVKGKKYPTTVVDFLRKATLTKVLLAAARWGEAGVSIMKDLRLWQLEILEASNLNASNVYFGKDVWEVVLDDDKIMKDLDTTHLGNATLNPALPEQEGEVYQGSINGFHFFTYAGSYVDDDGNVQKYVPDDEIVMAANGIGGTRGYGCIKDVDAMMGGDMGGVNLSDNGSLISQERFFKAKKQFDPSSLEVLGQSAPLPFAPRINGTLGATVL